MYSLAGTHLDFSSLLLKQISSTEWPERSTATWSRLNQQVSLANCSDILMPSKANHTFGCRPHFLRISDYFRRNTQTEHEASHQKENVHISEIRVRFRSTSTLEFSVATAVECVLNSSAVISEISFSENVQFFFFLFFISNSFHV